MRLISLVAAMLSCFVTCVVHAEDSVSFEFALYFAPAPAGDTEKSLADLIEKRPAEFGFSRDAKAVVRISSRWSELAEYALPSEEGFRYSAIDLQASDRAVMAKANRVFIVSFSAAKADLLKANRLACGLMADLAASSRANVWDEETRQLFSLKAWKDRRVEGWQGDIPDASKHVTMHAYKDPSLLRLITLGLRKFGVPDLVMTDVASQQSRSAGNLVNAAMQRLVEGAFPERRRLHLKLSEIQHEDVKKTQSQNPGKDAKGEVMIEFKTAVRQDGDPSNELWEVEFPNADGKTAIERQQIAFAELFGSTDKIIGADKGDPEMAAASEKARKAFFKNESKYRAGLGPNEHLVVKMGFPYGEDDSEYMWVEVVSWQKDAILGVLMNDPYHVKGLKSGSKVTVPLSKVYDYLFYRADGTTEGNETGKVLEKREAGR